MKNIRKAIKNGLSEKTALNALTIIPAKSIGLEDKIGLLDNNYLANFLITTGPIFDDKTEIIENWVKGERHVIKNTDKINVDGDYSLELNNNSYNFIFIVVIYK